MSSDGRWVIWLPTLIRLKRSKLVATMTHVTEAIRFGEPPPQKARVQGWVYNEGTGGSRLYAVPFIRDEYELSREPLQKSLRFDCEVNWLQFRSMERGSYTFPLEAMSITASATMNEFDESDGEPYWDRVNKRRVFLIDKELNSSLDEEENTELERLQAHLASYVDAIAPLPFAELEVFEALIDGQ